MATVRAWICTRCCRTHGLVGAGIRGVFAGERCPMRVDPGSGAELITLDTEGTMNEGSDLPCRCGWDGTGQHMCHRCGKAPGSIRFYGPKLVPLAGMQMKFQVRDTWGCDPCWAVFTEEMQAARMVRGNDVPEDALS